ncbi:MAG: hypothetical protein O2840_00440 [bacterium]|nr:hypothetical protein [bacterium]
MSNITSFTSSLSKYDRAMISNIIRNADLTQIASQLKTIVTEKQELLESDQQYRDAVTFAVECALMLNLNKRTGSKKQVSPLFDADFYPKLSSSYRLHGQ